MNSQTTSVAARMGHSVGDCGKHPHLTSRIGKLGLDALKLFGMGYSWGGFESLAIPFDCVGYRTATTWAPGGASCMTINKDVVEAIGNTPLMRAHSKGASCEVVNRAFRKEADAQAKFNEISGGRVPDDRYSSGLLREIDGTAF
jgi:hypothetical protein